MKLADKLIFSKWIAAPGRYHCTNYIYPAKQPDGKIQKSGNTGDSFINRLIYNYRNFLHNSI
jgi:hypothetical protein